jgi:uncharacterized protein (TIGR00369 family)
MTDDRSAAAPPPDRTRTVSWDDPFVYAQARGMSGLELLQSVAEGRLPWPPIQKLLGYEGGIFEDGRVTMTLEPAEFHYNPLGAVHGGVLATILDTVMACAVHTKLPAGDSYTTLDVHVNFVRGVTVQSGRVRAVGEVIHFGRRVATAKGELVDGAGRLCAHATTTCMILRAEGGGKERG